MNLASITRIFLLAAIVTNPNAHASVAERLTRIDRIQGHVQADAPLTVNLPDLEAGRYLIDVDQSEVDLHVTLQRTGSEDLTVNSLTERNGPEYFAFEVSTPEALSIVLSAPDQFGVTGQYCLDLYKIPSADEHFWNGLAATTASGHFGTDESDASRNSAILHLTTALTAFEASGDLESQAYVHYWLGTNHYWLLQISQAEEHYLAAEKLFAQLDESFMLQIARMDLAAAIMEAQKFDQAESLFHPAVAHLSSSGQKYAAAVGTNNLGLMEIYRGNLTAAETYFLAAEIVFVEIGHVSKAAQVHANIALVYERRAHLRDARRLYLEALDMVPDGSNDRLRAIFLTNLAFTETRLGNANKALVLLGAAIELQEVVGDEAGLAWALNGIAEIYRSLNKPKAAIVYQKRSVEIRRRRQEGGGLASALLSLGDDYWAIAKRPTDEQTNLLAESTHAEALSFAANDSQRAAIQLALARDKVERQDFANAEKLLRQALETAGEVANDDIATDARLELARLPIVDQQDALRHIRSALNFLANRDDTQRKAIAYAALAQQTGDHGEAIRNNGEALAALRDVRRRVANPWLATRLTESEYPIIEHQLNLLLKKPTQEVGIRSGLELARAYRANALTALLAELEAPITESVRPDLLNDIERAHENYREVLERLNVAREIQDQPLIDRYNEEIRFALGEIDVARAKARAERPDYAAVTFPEIPPIEQIQDWVRREASDSTCILFYFVGEDRSYGWAVFDDQVVNWQLPGEADLSAAINDLADTISGLSAVGTEKLWVELHSIAAVLLPPNDVLRTVDRIVLIPDGPIGAVPFAALPVRLGSRTEFLIERAELSTALSMSALMKDDHVAKTDHRMRTVVIAQNNLNGARRVAFSSLGETPSTQVIALTDEHRSFARLSDDLAGKGVIHFATHAWVDVENPELSGLALGAMQGRRFDLTLADIFQLKLDASLVFLSACETMLGDAIRGEGTLSLVRGFLYAGAQQVIATNWRIDERSARHISDMFFEELFQNHPTPSEALRIAQLRMLRENPDMRHPYYWAGYTITGR